MSYHIKRKHLKPTPKKIGKGGKLDSQISHHHEYVSIGHGISGKPTEHFFETASEEELIKYDQLVDELVKEVNEQYIPDYWIQKDVEYFKAVLSNRGYDPINLRPIEIYSLIKKNHPEEKIGLYATQAWICLNTVKNLLGLEASNKKTEAIFIEMQKIAQFKQFILIAQNDIAISTHKEKIKKLKWAQNNKALASSNEIEEVRELVTRWHKQGCTLPHNAKICKAIDELYNSGKLPDPFIDDNGEERERSSTISEEVCRFNLAKNISQHYIKKKDIK